MGCGPLVVDHTSGANVMMADNASFETSVGNWVAWFSTAIARDREAARVGEWGLRITITEPNGWGIETSNWPGTVVKTTGLHRVSFSARVAHGAPGPAELGLDWGSEDGTGIRKDDFAIEWLGTEWVRVVKDVSVPAGTTRVYATFRGRHEAGMKIDFDGLSIVPPAND